ncbi:MAG: universal stress protein [Ignavibacteriae bacterium]|nr:universal stress protein [Ignavibacteriota bacterium]
MYNLNRILVPTDFSVHASSALEHAVLLGSEYKAEITLLHVDEFIVSPLGERGIHQPFLEAYQKKKEEYLEAQLGMLKKSIGDKHVAINTKVIPGRSYKVIVEESENEAYDLVVIATRGLTHLSPHLIGSTAERVVRLSRQPVLSVQSRPRHGGKVHSVLCSTDLSPAANVALSYALSIAKQNDAILYVLYASELDKPEDSSDIRKRLPNLEEFHPEACKVKVEYVFDRDVEPSNSIIRFAEDRDVGMIVMSTHGRKGIRRVHIGNNTAEVVRQSTRPVLTMTHPIHKVIFSRPATQPHIVIRSTDEHSGEVL